MQAIALLLTLLLPVILIYFIRSESKPDSLQSPIAKKKKKSKKKASKGSEPNTQSAPAVKSDEQDRAKRDEPDRKTQLPIEKPLDTKPLKSLSDDEDLATELKETTEKPETFVEVKRKKEVNDSQVSRMTIDDDLDGTSRYSRVMRIKTDEPVSRPGLEPLEPGWNRAASKRNELLWD